MPNSSYSFSSYQRLKSRVDIAALFRENQSVYVSPVRILYRFDAGKDSSVLQSAVAVPKRQFPKAHTRNRLKRLMRESFRLEKQELDGITAMNHGTLQVLFLYSGKQITTFNEMKEKFKVALIRLKKDLERVA